MSGARNLRRASTGSVRLCVFKSDHSSDVLMLTVQAKHVWTLLVLLITGSPPAILRCKYSIEMNF